MAEPIDVLFVVWTRGDPRKHVLTSGVHIGATWRI